MEAHAVARLKVADAGTSFLHDASDFMTERQRQRMHAGRAGAIVGVRVTNARGFHAH